MADKKIGSHTYRVEKMPATEATRNLIRLTKLVGPGISKLSAVMSKSEDVRDAAALVAIVDILMGSDADDLTKFLVEIAEKAEVKDGGGYMSVIYDIHPADLVEAFQLVAFVLQVNYRDFFAGKLAGLMSAVKPAA